jgi:ADP-ribose pyrophosphatase YjhB (NUDIX family)
MLTKPGLEVTIPFEQILDPPRWENEFKLRVTSVGIWCVVNNIPNDPHRHILLAQQADQKPVNGEFPWGPPAGRVEMTIDSTPEQAALRELREETGIDLNQSRLEILAIAVSKQYQPGNFNKAGILFLAELDYSELKVDTLTLCSSGTYQYEPPPNVNRGEICMLALRPIQSFRGPSEWPEIDYKKGQHNLAFRALSNIGYMGYVQQSFPFMLERLTQRESSKLQYKRS